MAVGTSTASGMPGSGSDGPIRTCIGCRQRAAAAVLLRVAVAPDATGAAAARAEPQLGSAAISAVVPVVPDPHRRIPGRGAWVHRDPDCVRLAQRRRAFGRALRVPGLIDSSAVSEYVAQAAPDYSGAHGKPENPADSRRR